VSPLVRLFRSQALLFIAFAFAVMADPVSSVAYAIEAALRALDGDLGLLLPTMAVVIGIVGVVVVNYQQIVARYPMGGGAATATQEAFGPGWAFVPLGALIVDFVLTISISAAAASSAIIAYVPALAGARVVIALGLLVGVAALTWYGHGGRVIFAMMTLSFLVVTAVMLAMSFSTPAVEPILPAAHDGIDLANVMTVMLAFPVGMALATGVEAPPSAIAQLGQLDEAGRVRFGRRTLWLTLLIVGSVTLGLTAAAVRLGIGIPPPESTQLAQLAQRSASPLVFALFQATSAILLLAAASSSFQAGPGLLKALAGDGLKRAVLPVRFGRTNRHHTPVSGVVVFLVASALAVIAAGGQDQELVLFYAVAVFISFLAGLSSMARLDRREGRRHALVLNVIGVVLVGFTLAVNLARGLPIVSLVASLVIAVVLHRFWVRAGRPTALDLAE
jgi:hypothetical protein